MLVLQSPAGAHTLSLFGEGLTIKLLAWLALSSVSEEDARVASAEVARRLLLLARPKLLAELKAHQVRTVVC